MNLRKGFFDGPSGERRSEEAVQVQLVLLCSEDGEGTNVVFPRWHDTPLDELPGRTE